jgi:uncharacterized protein
LSQTLPPGDFLGETCRLWEAAADPFADAGVRVVRMRTAVVLARHGSALNKMTAPARAGLIVRLGKGDQYFPWIHIDDLSAVYHKALTDTAMSGPYNAVAPHQVTHDMLMGEVARQKRLPVFLPHVPGWLLRAVLGEMAVVLTEGSRISSDRLSETGFRFRYPDISSALRACCGTSLDNTPPPVAGIFLQRIKRESGSFSADYLIVNSFSGRMPALVVITVAVPLSSPLPYILMTK